MDRIGVSLISEQTIPNVLFSMHFKPERHLFVTTEKSEESKKSDAIIDLLLKKGIIHSPKDYEKIVVNQDDFLDCYSKLKDHLEKQHGGMEYVVNITGGNKIMAIAVYDTFKEIGEKVTIGYIPLGRNIFEQLFPLKTPMKEYEIKERLNIEDYLLSYSFTIKNKKALFKIKKNAEENEKLSSFITHNYEKVMKLLELFSKELRDKRKSKSYYTLSKNLNKELEEVEKTFLKMAGFKVEGDKIEQKLDKCKINFLTGGWLEDYVFNELKELKKGNVIDDLAMALQIESGSASKNEIDVCFTKDNTFYYIECKSNTHEEKGETAIIRDEIYKKGALITQLGLGNSQRAFICTTLPQIGNTLSTRAGDYGVQIFNLNDTMNIKENILRRLKR
jgi:hypothetical protein